MRREDWVERLDAVFRDAQDKPFAWGDFDCCLFAASCVEAALGFDPAGDFRGTYSTRAQAFRLLRGRWGGGVGKMMEHMAAAHEWPEVRPLMARRGDVALVMADDGHCALAVVDLSGRAAAFPAPRSGLVLVPLTACLRAWRIQ